MILISQAKISDSVFDIGVSLCYDKRNRIKGGFSMENHDRITELLERMEKANRKQVAYARLQFIFTLIAAGCCAVLLFFGIKILPQLQETAIQAETVLGNLESVTTELAQADLSSMVDNVDTLVSNVDGLVGTSQTAVEQTMTKINAVDFDALNDAIKDLSAVIEPIANFFSSFKFK